MCLRNVYYPLYQDRNGNRALLFKLAYKIRNRTDYEKLGEYSHELELASNFDSRDYTLNRYFEKKDLFGGSLIKMVQIPCGCCRECLTEISRQWSFRILKEAEQYKENYFITFTYDEDSIPKNKMLDPNAISKFNKKLKTYLNRNNLNSDFRFYAVGEYGSQTARPHYHVIYFNLDIPDLKFELLTPEKNMVFSSKFLTDTWGQGFVTIETLDVGSACYVARYCDKKRRLTPDEKKKLEEKGIVPEFSRMSNRPGIGANYLEIASERFVQGIYQDYVQGKSYSYPLYYNKKIKDMMSGTLELKLYEEQARKKSVIKMAQQMQLSDFVEDLESYNNSIDKIKNRQKL